MTRTSEPSPDEAGLIARAADGDMAAFEELVMLHADRLYMALRRFGLDDDEAQEVAQETFLRAWRALPGFEGRSRFFTWLYRIGFNEAQRKLGRRRPEHGTTAKQGLDLDDLVDESPRPDERLERDELRSALAAGLRELPPKLRAPVVLRDVEGMSTSEAASVLEIGEAAFKSRLHRGRTALRDLVDGALLRSVEPSG